MERFFVSRPIFAIALSVAIVALGLLSLAELPVEQYPDITPPVVEVSATYPGADAETVNNAVTTPLAESIMGVSDMLYMQCTSANDGTATLQILFDIGSDPDMDAVFTQNRVAAAQAKLPEAVLQQGITTEKTMTGFLLVYALHSDGRYNDEWLSNYAYINLQNELLKINGVGKIQIMGAGEYAMRIWLKPDLLKYYGIPLDAVTEAINAQSRLYPVGQFGAEPAPEGTPYTYTVTLPPAYNTAEEFARIVVYTTPSGEQIRLGRIADVELGSQSYGVSSRFEGNPTTLMVIYQEPGSNAMQVGAAIKEAMNALSERFPDGVTATSIVDTTTSIRAGVKDIFHTLLIALVLVIAIIYLFLQDWRSTLIPLVAIPVSLIGAFAIFPLLGFTINIISLLALVLAIGLVVDDAIVVVEAVQVNLARGLKPREATLEAMRNVSSPIVATTVVLLAVFVPMSFAGGVAGLMFQQFSVTIAVSVVLSAFNALTLSPALCALVLRPVEMKEKGVFGPFNRWFAREQHRYTERLPIFVRHTLRTALLTGAMLLVIALLWRSLPDGFLPDEDQGYVMVMVNTPEASSLQVTSEAMLKIDERIRRHEAVLDTSFAAGFNLLAGIATPHSGVIFVALKPFGDRRATAMEVAEELNGELYATIPEADCYAFIPPSIPGLGVTSGVTVELQDIDGRGTGYLMGEAQRLIAALEKEPTVASVTTQFNDGIPQRRLVVDREQALAMGINLETLYGDLSAMLGGRYIDNFTRFGRLYQTYLQASPDYRQDGSALESYFVSSSTGESVPLSTLVEVRDTVGTAYVSQFNLYRSITLTITPIAAASSATVMGRVMALGTELLPDNVGLAWSGVSFQEAAEAGKGAWIYLVTLLFVFLALAALYESWSLPLAILLSVPAAVLGALGFVALAHQFEPHYINDIYLDISLVMLIGLAAKNAILVVEYADKLFKERGISLLDASIEAARLRLRPILMTAFSFILGVVPLVFASGVYSTARNILGVALVGGMLLATLLGILIYPALYYLVGRLARFEERRAAQNNAQGS